MRPYRDVHSCQICSHHSDRHFELPHYPVMWSKVRKLFAISYYDTQVAFNYLVIRSTNVVVVMDFGLLFLKLHFCIENREKDEKFADCIMHKTWAYKQINDNINKTLLDALNLFPSLYLLEFSWGKFFKSDAFNPWNINEDWKVYLKLFMEKEFFCENKKDLIL